MITKSRRERFAYFTLLAAFGIVVYAIWKGSDLMALATLLPSLVGVAWAYIRHETMRKSGD